MGEAGGAESRAGSRVLAGGGEAGGWRRLLKEETNQDLQDVEETAAGRRVISTGGTGGRG